MLSCLVSPDPHIEPHVLNNMCEESDVSCFPNPLVDTLAIELDKLDILLNQTDLDEQESLDIPNHAP